MACDVILELIVELKFSRKPVHPRLKTFVPLEAETFRIRTHQYSHLLLAEKPG